MRKMSFIVAISLLIVGGWWMFLKPQEFAEQANKAEGAAMVDVILPASFTTQAGRDGLGPPLIHKIYEPGHHGDMSFQLAAMNGVRAHHWAFGNMPAVEGITPSDITNITTYVRAIQRANGIN
mgnify:CR=1 FL=1